MNFSAAFWKALRSRPTEALGALYWHVTGRKVRARNRLRLSLAQSARAYQHWIEMIERRDVTVRNAEAKMANWKVRPSFTIVAHPYERVSQAAFDDVVEMLRSQIYPDWELIIVLPSDGPELELDPTLPIRVTRFVANGDTTALREAAAIAAGQFLLPLAEGTTLPQTALYHYAEALQEHPQAVLLFGDNDRIDDRGARHTPWFKPKWNEELALAQDYLSQAIAISTDVARTILESGLHSKDTTAYELALTAGSMAPDNLIHIAHVQSHLGADAAELGSNERLQIVQTHLDAINRSGARASPGPFGTLRIDWPLTEPFPLVSIIIPTRDKEPLLRACVSSLLERTRYQPFEILIVDNGSRQAKALSYLAELAGHSAIRVIRDDRPYNFSRLNNMAVAEAEGDFVCLLNNDTEIIEDEWLKAMMRQAVRPQVGAVGARLLYADGSIQHAGVVVGMGDAAGHAHRFLPRSSGGYFARSHTAHYVSAVTAACLVVSKEKFLAVGGFDDEELAIAFNDVDLCLKLQRAGWRNVYTPQATLLHHESKSRGKDVSPKHIERYRRELRTLQARWNAVGYLDPLHHPHLDRSMENYLIRL